MSASFSATVDARRPAGPSRMPEAGASGFGSRLRRETADAHQSMEDALGIAPATVTRERIVAFLAGLYGFHRMWEPWLDGCGLDAGLIAPRRKLALLERDLRALGIGDPDALASYPGDFGAQTPEAAYGSLYVVEGSTLGSRIMRRWIAATNWAPRDGLVYFEGYGSDTGAMWRLLQAELETAAVRHDAAGIIDHARATFARLQAWLTPGEAGR